MKIRSYRELIDGDWENSTVDAVELPDLFYWVDEDDKVLSSYGVAQIAHPIKILRDNRPGSYRRSVFYIAVRNDAYPLMWVLYTIWLKLIEIAYHDTLCCLFWARALGLYDPKPGYSMSWEDWPIFPKIIDRGKE